MTRLGFFALLVSCASAPPPATVEIAQPLPTVATPATATPATASVTIADPLEIEGLRDPRRRFPRPRALVVTETSALEQLVATTAQSSPDRPLLLWRMAENYVELRKDHADGAARKAIDVFKHLVDEYPSFTRMDEVLYDMGLEYEIAGDVPQARRTQYELIKQFPSSRFVAYAYFAFGEMFIGEANTDATKLELAMQSFREVLKLASPLSGLAACRLVRIARLKRDEAEALSLEQKYGRNCGT